MWVNCLFFSCATSTYTLIKPDQRTVFMEKLGDQHKVVFAPKATLHWSPNSSMLHINVEQKIRICSPWRCPLSFIKKYVTHSNVLIDNFKHDMSLLIWLLLYKLFRMFSVFECTTKHTYFLCNLAKSQYSL